MSTTSLRFWILFVIVFSACLSLDPLGAGWERINRKCIQINREYLKYTAAGNACKNQGASLLSIANELELNFTSTLIKTATLWIGLRRDSPTSKWYWKDGREFVNDEWWQGGKPPKTEILGVFREGILSASSDAAIFYICDKKATKVLTKVKNTDYNFDELCGVEIMPNCEDLPCDVVCQAHHGCDQYAKMLNVCVNIKHLRQTDNCVVKLRPSLELYKWKYVC